MRRRLAPAIAVASLAVAAPAAYEATIALDPSDEKSPALSATLEVGDHWMWPLLALALGAALAYVLVGLRDMLRPKRVLQLALTQAQQRCTTSAATVGAKGHPKPYTLDGLFPPGTWDGTAAQKPAALELFCKINDAGSQEELDAIATQVTDLEKRVNAWPSVCAKANALEEAKDELADRPHAAKLKSASEALVTNAAVPEDEAATSAYMKSMDEQVEAVREWLAADALFVEAAQRFGDLDDPPDRHDPARWLPDLQAAKSLADLERCRVVPGLCRDVHVLRALTAQRVRALESAAGELEISELVSIMAPPPALEGPALTAHLRAVIADTDITALLITTGVAALAYMLTIYTDTYGSAIDYLTAFAAGAGATFAASWKLLPWYTTFKRPK